MKDEEKSIENMSPIYLAGSMYTDPTHLMANRKKKE